MERDQMGALQFILGVLITTAATIVLCTGIIAARDAYIKTTIKR